MKEHFTVVLIYALSVIVKCRPVNLANIITFLLSTKILIYLSVTRKQSGCKKVSLLIFDVNKYRQIRRKFWLHV